MNVIDRLPYGIGDARAVRDESGNIVDFEWVYANAHLHDLIDLPNGKLVGTSVRNTDDVFGKNFGLAGFSKAVESGESSENISDIDDPSSPFFGKSYYFCFYPDGDVCAIFANDVTSIIAETERARGQFRMFREAANCGLIGKVITDEEGHIHFANPAFTTLIGYDVDDILGRDVGEFYHPDDHKIDGTDVANDVRFGDRMGATYDKRFLSKSGEDILCSITLTKMIDETSGQTYMVGQIRDVREERRKEHQLKNALQQAQQATQMKSEFLANMSHEIRTPLNGVIGMAQVLAHSELDPEQTENVETIIDSGRSLMALLNDILDLSKIEAGKLDMAPVDCDVRHKLRRIHQLFEPIAEEKGLELRFFVDPSVPAHLRFDPVRVRQCVSNLVSNAVKFTESGSIMIVVTAQPNGDGQHELRVFVTDTGIGISSDQQEQIFDSFQQADGSTTRRFGGTGLGLSVTRNLARLMGGDITVTSEVGRGSVFIFSFRAAEPGHELHIPDDTNIEVIMPTGPASAVPPTRTPNSDLAYEDGPRKLGGLHVLVVDDNRVNRRVARSFLKQYAMTSREAENGQEALDLMANEAFDLVLMDIHMPVLDGVSTTRAIREQPAWANLPVIALTADAMTGDRVKYLSEGMSGYVAKPIEQSELMKEIHRVIDGDRSGRKAG